MIATMESTFENSHVTISCNLAKRVFIYMLSPRRQTGQIGCRSSQTGNDLTRASQNSRILQLHTGRPAAKVYLCICTIWSVPQAPPSRPLAHFTKDIAQTAASGKNVHYSKRSLFQRAKRVNRVLSKNLAFLSFFLIHL